MSAVELILSYFVVVFCAIGLCFSYSLLTRPKIKMFTLKNILIYAGIAFLQMIISLSQYNLHKMTITFIVVYIMFLAVFQENYKKTFIKTLIIIIMEILFELLYSFIMFMSKLDIQTFDSTAIIKNLVSILIISSILLVLNIKRIRVFIKNIIKNICEKKDKLLSMVILAFYVYIAFLVFTYMINISSSNYISNFMFLSITLFCVYFLILEHYKMLKSKAQQQILLEFMSKYEYLLDKDRINRHEMLNNLVILNSYGDKNSDAFKTTIAQMIENYNTDNNSELKNISRLPTGIKGILYYKISDIEINNIKLIFNCSKKVNKYLKDTNNDEYTKCSKLVGIFLDNAIDAAKYSKEKTIIIDIYLEDNQIVFYIENSIKEKVDLNIINDKYYSTKGVNRGLGLYIAKKIKNRSNKLDYTQKLTNNNTFVTELRMTVK